MMEDYRYEIKFILNELEIVEAFRFMKIVGALNKYPNRTINSLYLDTVDFEAVRDNLAGISNRHKIRLRWYDNNTDVNLEVKIRDGRLGAKKRYHIPTMSSGEIYKLTAKSICKNAFDYLLEDCQNNLIFNDMYIPILFVNYEREYYECFNGLRITIDKKISFRDVMLNSFILDANKLPYNEYIMELKFPLDMKDTVSSMMKSLNLTPKRHSKYIVGMSKLGYVLYV